MTINPDAVLGWAFEPATIDYSERDTMFYALSLGIGQDPLDPAQLRHVYERDLVALPSMAAILGHPGSWLANPATGVDYSKVVHGEQHCEFLAPLPPSGSLRCVGAVDELIDKGEGRGALVSVTRTLVDAESGEPLARVRNVLFARADGGFGGNAQSRHVPLPPCPDTAPDFTFEWPTQNNQALLYRLNSDMNPLHADPEVAAAAGFPRPVLHGLASYGIAGYAAIQCLCDGRAERLRSLAVRLSAPVYPGETFRIEMWRTGPGAAALKASLTERNVTLLNNGMVTWDDG